MEPNRFDHLSRALAAHGPRRRVLGLLATVPVVAGLVGILTSEETEAAGRRKRRKKSHKHGKGRRRKHHKKRTCIPDCTGKSCDADGCRGSCGSCTAPETCGGGGTPGTCGCTPDCTGKGCEEGDGCGGRCQTCPTCQTCSAGSCTPVADLTSCSFTVMSQPAVGWCVDGTCICKPTGGPCDCDDFPTIDGCCTPSCACDSGTCE